ncbi:site-specific integrase [Tissierella creatinophila]|uniref:Tyrosine recombinase XerC n=1 Tax=Tissierella creatinophila DSM 6911 TaxID=1123403 RepID=A0A1U7M572_TISCR|nr:site-specific integrase [Tissierella creatinophila]OLS02436.1 tyrosine recombinase XerC [Tissierella creatinophila DSM 6911]
MEYNITYRQRNGGWQYIISFKDETGKWKQRSKQGFKTKSIAKIAADDRLDEMKENFILTSNNEYADITFKEFIDIYIGDLELQREYNTANTTKFALKKFISLNDILIKDIQFVNIQGCVNSMIKEGLKVSTIKEYVTKIRTIFNNAIDPYMVISINPVGKIKYPQMDDNSTDKKIKALTKKELDYVLSHPKVYNKRKDYMTMRIASSCGLRLGEIAGLTWDCIDFKTCTITVNKQWKKDKQGKYGFGKLKSKNSYRTIPASKELMRELYKYKSDIPTDIYNRIFNEKQTVNMSIRIRKRFQSLGMDNSLHDLRHTYVTLLIPHVDFKTIAKLIGDTVEIVMKVYSHVNEDMMENATNAINEVFI